MQVLSVKNKVHRLQGPRGVRQAAYPPRQDFLAQAQRKLCKLSEKSQAGNKTGTFYGTAALYKLIVRL
jgi:hypothetical protein